MAGIKENDPLTEKIIGCCFDVHTALGPGFKEQVYQNALKLALERKKLKFTTEQTFDISFLNEVVGTYRADLVVEDEVIIELKAVVGFMPKIFESQLLSYLKASKIKVGLLVNFGNRKCFVKRYVV